MQNNPYPLPPPPHHEFHAPVDLFAAAADADARAGFIMKTYLYLLGAIAAFIVLETLVFTIVGLENLAVYTFATLGTSKFSWLIVLGAFMVVSWIAQNWASSDTSPAMQHAGLGVYVVANVLIFIPLLCLAYVHGGGLPTIISAATATAALFGMLTVAVFITRKDFSFLRSFLTFGGLAAFGFIITAIYFDFALGPIFIYAMIALMCGYILYHTSNILHHYRIGQHVAASLALFGSVMTLFWYILQLFLSRGE